MIQDAIPHHTGGPDGKAMGESNHLTRLERLIRMRHAEAAWADVHELAQDLHGLGIGEVHQNRPLGWLSDLPALFMNRYVHRLTGCAVSYNLSLRLNVRREIPRRAAALC